MRARLGLFVSQECDMGDQISCLICPEITVFVCKQWGPHTVLGKPRATASLQTLDSRRLRFFARLLTTGMPIRAGQFIILLCNMRQKAICLAGVTSLCEMAEGGHCFYFQWVVRTIKTSSGYYRVSCHCLALKMLSALVFIVFSSVRGVSGNAVKLGQENGHFREAMFYLCNKNDVLNVFENSRNFLYVLKSLVKVELWIELIRG